MENNTNYKFTNKLTTKIISLFLSLLIIFFAVPSIIYAEAAEAISGLNDEESAILSEENVIKENAEIYEVEELRKENVKHFRLEDGSYIAAVYPGAVHVSDGEGGWTDIDNSLHLLSGDIGTSDGRIKLSKKITGNESLFSLHLDNKKITFGLSGARKGTVGEVTNYSDRENDTELQKMMNLEKLSASVIYREILSGVDLEYVLRGNAVKENLIIKEKSDSYSYTFEISLNGLSASLNEDGSVHLSDTKGSIVYVIPAPIIFDANGLYGSADYTLASRNGNGKYALTVTANSEWMNADNRAFPVVLDPALYPSDSSFTDTYISTEATSMSYPTSNHLQVSSSNIAYIKSSDFSFIPKNSYISNAALTLVARGTYSANVGVYLVTSDWDNTLTYAQAEAASSGTVGDIISYVNVNSANGDVIDFDITEAVRGWYGSTSANYGVALKLLGQTGYAVFHSMDSSESELMPTFKINYANHSGVESYYSYSSHNVGDVASGYVNLATGGLVLDISLLTATNSVMPYTVSLTYDSKRAALPLKYTNSNVPYIYAAAPLGYKWSMQQSVVKRTYTNENGVTKNLYIWCDADGTEHTFFEGESAGVYEDNSGLGLKLRETTASSIHITSKDKTVYAFSAVAFPGEYLGGWILSAIHDRNGNKITFTYDTITYKPLSVSFTLSGGFGTREIFRFVYTSSSSTSAKAVYDVLTGRGVVFSYSSTYNGSLQDSNVSYLRTAQYVTGETDWTDSDWKYFNTGKVISSLDISYTQEGLINSARESVSGAEIGYSYFGGKVSAVYENNSSLYPGQRLEYTYGGGYTDVRSSGSDDVHGNDDDIITRNIFDSYGRAISVYSRNAAGTKVYNGILGEYESQENVKNNIKEVIDIGEGSANYLVNGGFEDGDGFEYWAKSADVSIGTAADRPKSANEARFAVTPQSSNYVYQVVNIPAGTYTLSLDLTTTFTHGVRVGGSITNMSNVMDVKDIQFGKNDRLNDYTHGGSIKRVAESFTISSGGFYKIEIYANGDSSAENYGQVYVDNVMLTPGRDMAEYNLVDFGDFDIKAYDVLQTPLSLNTRWTLTGTAAASSSYAISGSSLRMYSSDVSSVNLATQRIYESDEGITNTAEKKFIVSGYGRAENALISNNAKFGLRVNVGYEYYANGVFSVSVDEFRFDFNPECTDWQFVSGSFTTRAYDEILYVDVICEYSGQIDSYAYFDNISIVDASDYNRLKYTYYGNGNVRTASDFSNTDYYRYDSEDNLIAKANSYGVLYEYTYDSNGNPETETLYDYYLTQSGNSGPSVYPLYAIEADPTVDVNTLITKTMLMRTVYEFNSYGLLTASSTETYSTETGNSNSIDNSYTYETGNWIFFGAIKTHTDTLGNVTNYFYSTTETGTVSATLNGNNGTAVYTDIWGNIEKVEPAVTNLFTGYDPKTDGAFVEYDYNSKNQLQAVTTDSTAYTFTYDSYGNRSTVKAGENSLAAYTYNANNGKLKTVTYGNGFSVEYFYNDLENVSEVWYTVNGTSFAAYRYDYTESGLLYSVEDVRSGKTTVYNYDKNRRLALVTEYDTEDMSNDLTARYQYNDYGDIQYLSYMLAYTSGGGFYDKKFTYTYGYDDMRRLSYEDLSIESSGHTYTYYTYDGFERVNNVRISYSNTFALDTDYTFSGTSYTTSTQVGTYKTTVNSNAQTTYIYTYDTKGNITAISVNGTKYYSYEYDELGQLVRENNYPLSKTYVYEYDNSGNITSVKNYPYTEGDDFEVLPDTISYGYSGGTWGDILTSYNGSSIIYDGIGNPLSYYGNRSFSWEGRRLVGATNGTVAMSFVYNEEGIRTAKTVNGVTTNYYLNGSQIVAEETNGNITIYLYNSLGLIGFYYHGASYGANVWDTYFYEKNLQGDIVAVYDTTGTKKASYVYDAWGNFTVTYHNGASAESLYNPFTYRGYYYDKDLNLYYLNSRYYDSVTRRFINADGYVSTGQGILGNNMYAYCNNNPVVRVDYNGEWWFFANAFVGGIVGGASKIASNVATGESFYDGLLGAFVGGAVGGLVSAATKDVAAAAYSGAAAEAVINEIIAYTPFSDSNKELNMQNLQSSIATVSEETLINGTVSAITGKFAEKIIPTNKGWFTPKKFKSSFVGKYASKVHYQTAIQGAAGIYTSLCENIFSASSR